MISLPDDVLPYFVDAGWHPGRAHMLSAPAVDCIPADHPAREILTQFSGLRVGRCGAGRECATSDIVFMFVDYRDEFEDEVNAWNALLGTTLVGIGETHHSHGALFVDTGGRLFNFSYVHDLACHEGESFVEGVRGLLVGMRCRPLLRPNQDYAMAYGMKYTADSVEVYRYS